ncbi:OX-2 membrane glycoprotein-like isoform X3 [Salvelinus alpinus]|uniref:OX-2 membrane glycoprotein-like isoform X3 n=1 Tax=Salvelinus alpinus TaxID=8036 RepID=UPI0039FD2620
MNTFLILFCLLSEAVSVNIVTRRNNTADFNADASYTCSHADPTGVLQVTWQRLFKDDSVENLATYSKRFGVKIIDPHRGKVVFTEASLNSTSITVKNVTWADEACYICSFNVYPSGSRRKQTCLTVQVNPPFQRNVEFEDEGLQNCSIVNRGVSRGDESCYKCLFNTYPDGPISGRTCLHINELYGPSLLITQTNNSHTALSCSATGRPVPIVTWDHIMIEHSTTVDVTHPNELSQLLQQCPVYLTKTPRLSVWCLLVVPLRRFLW